MRQSPAGLYVYREDGTTEVPLTETRGAYAPEIEELYDALVYGKPVLHGGDWGLATLEVCLAIMQSGRSTGTSRCSTRWRYLMARRGKIS